MATETAVINASSGVQTFYTTYAAARSAASAGDLIQIWADLNEQIILKNEVDIWIAPGRVLDVSTAVPTITDNNVSLVCSIYGNGIIKNTYTENYPTGPYYECIKILHGGSKISIQCDSIDGAGGVTPDTIDGSSVKVTDASKFHLCCQTIINRSNTAIEILNCSDINIQTKKIESGDNGSGNNGSPVVLLQGTGFISADELICGGKGSCLDFKAGNITANIIKITSLETENAGYPTILLDDGSQNQNLILYFDEIQNLNSNGGDAVKITEGIATLIGRRIYALNGMSVDLNNIIISALIQSDEIISETKGINISNSDEQVIIDANYIEGSNGNDGVIRSASGSNYLIRNAKITNTYTSSPSIGIYLDTGSQTIEIENLIIVTGTETNDFSIFRNSTTNIDIKNLGLFVKKAISMHITLKIGTGTGTGENFKYIISNDIT